MGLFIIGSLERQKVPNRNSKNPSWYQNDQWHLRTHFKSLLLKPGHPRTSVDAFPNGALGRPDLRTDKRHPKIGLYTLEGHPDHGTGVRLCFGAHLGLPSRSQPGEKSPFCTETWPETLLMNRQCIKSALTNPEDLKA
ncbi:hypothetical protein CRG98_034582 [Punica granatum]|uniref:Uncharacterized protein n=1 Tax=Punica granatum TaxID=22663 RepID=A0A2I0ILY3_PUNGR|nr:hypothetical protein CRG98_034582 [Punica granatum]